MDWLTTKEAICYFQVSLTSLNLLRDKGQVQVFRLSQGLRWNKADLEAVIMGGKGGKGRGRLRTLRLTWLSKVEAADYIGVCTSTIENMEKEGILRAYRIYLSKPKRGAKRKPLVRYRQIDLDNLFLNSEGR